MRYLKYSCTFLYRIVDGELRVPVYGCGRLPSPVSMLPLCESPPPLMMTSEEAEELERVKLHGPPEPLPCQPIPKSKQFSLILLNIFKTPCVIIIMLFLK